MTLPQNSGQSEATRVQFYHTALYGKKMAQALLIVGAGIVFLLGLVHAILTLRDLSNPRTFTPTDAAMRTAMPASKLAIAPRAKSNLWKAWLGFNLSHSLGILLFGGELLGIGLFQFTLFAHSPLIQSVTLLVSAAYFVMAVCFWFSRPTIGSAAAFLCFLGATVLSHAS
jgi:hypothetical protein